MHAVFVQVDLTDADPTTAAEALRNEIVPRVSQLPGFQSGTWLAPTEDRKGNALIVFDSEENARAASERISVGSNPQPGVVVERSDVREVIVQA